MADARQQADWWHFGILAARIHQSMTGQKVDPVQLVPERYRPKKPKRPPKTPEQERAESDFAFRLLGEGLKAMMNR
jgi:hypothetical protein